jgi:hypothetical protein
MSKTGTTCWPPGTNARTARYLIEAVLDPTEDWNAGCVRITSGKLRDGRPMNQALLDDLEIDQGFQEWATDVLEAAQ